MFAHLVLQIQSNCIDVHVVLDEPRHGERIGKICAHLVAMRNLRCFSPDAGYYVNSYQSLSIKQCTGEMT